MIFEPAALKLHLAVGTLPSTDAPWRTLELAPLLAAGNAKDSVSQPSPAKSDQRQPARPASKSKTGSSSTASPPTVVAP